ncbi:phage tail length tape measure family protein [Sinorhizobium meliloti]|uniref:phage tail length tape measure family protein n=1 Tax=Rhizobium meliloti TaxID=382 RepID=UPI0003DC0763|nr:phage tail length tape measure family protein [Sinorhizobium meliloti]ARS70868.1 hypothetical protein SMRU11_28210 [Sinorhizobium meliloti RU11/001]RVM38501.1 hypothetical protein CN129_07535 [Sinorhizobium meliloti]
MATDNEQLVLSISADTRQIQRQLKSLVGQTQANTKAIEAAFASMGGSSAGAFDKIAANSNRAFTTAENGAKRFQNAMRASSQHTSNMAAQLQDIGVQLAGGQSPFLIGIQQLSQMNLGAMGVRGTLSAIGGAAATILSPVNLVGLAFITLGGAAIQYFAEVISGSDDSAKALEKQAQLIQQVAKEWGDAVPALREYADELERAASVSRLREGAGAVIGDIIASAREDLPQLREEILSVFNQLGGVSRDSSLSFAELIGKIGQADTALSELSEAYKAGGDASDELTKFNEALAAVLNHSAIPATGQLRDLVSLLAAEYGRAAVNAGELAAQAARAAYPSRGAYAGVERSADGPIQGGGFGTPEEGPVPESRPRIELEGLPGENRRSPGSGRSAAIREAEREKQAVIDLIAQLEFEQGLIGATNVEREKANALRRAGAAATPEQKAQIESLVETMYAERDAIKASQAAMEELADVGRDVLQGLAFDLLDGENRADAFANAISRLADRLLNSAFDGLFGGSAGTPRSGGLLGGAIIPGILHDGGQAGRDGYGHRRAVPASTFRGAPRFHNGTMGVGLGPSEVPAILEKGEIVLPKGAKVGSEGVNVTYAPQIDARGADAAAVARLEQVMARDRAEFESKTVAAIRNARSRGVKGV